MGRSPDSSEHYVRRNLPLLVVGLASMMLIIVGAVFVIDRIRDGDDDNPQVVTVSGSSNTEELNGAFGEMFDGLLADGLLLGVTISDEDGSLVVQRIVEGAPADNAGVEVGDRILEVNGDRVRGLEELRAAIADIEIGDEYELTVEREGDELTLDLTREPAVDMALAAVLERMMERGFAFEDPEFELQPFRMGAPDLVPDPFAEFRLRPTLGVSVVQTGEGLQVVTVVPGSVAADAGLEAGDVVLEVDGGPVGTIEELRAALPEIGARSGTDAPTIDLLVQRGGDELTLQATFPRASVFVDPDLGSPLTPGATPTPDLRTERLLEELDELQRRLESDEFLDRFDARLRERIESLLEEALEARAEAIEPGVQPEPADALTDLASLEVFRGTVEVLSDEQITLGGPRGSISFTVTEATTFVGGEPAIGGTSSVASNADREAILVLTVG